MRDRRRKKVTREEFRQAVWSAGGSLLLEKPSHTGEGRRERATPYLVALLDKIHAMEATTYVETPQIDVPFEAGEAPVRPMNWQDLLTLDSLPEIRVAKLLDKTRKEVMLIQEGPPQHIPETAIQSPEQQARMAAQAEAMEMVDGWILEAIKKPM